MIARVAPLFGVPPNKHPTILTLHAKYPRLKVVNAPTCKAQPFVLKEDALKSYDGRYDQDSGPPGVYIIDW